MTSDVITGTTDAAVGNELPTDGWERIRVTLNALTASAQAYVELVCSAASGTAWFACPQLETGEVMNAFNLVSNGDFRYTTTSGAQTLPLDWDQGANNLTTANTGVFAASTDSTFPSALEGNYVQVEGRPDKSLMGFVQYYDMTGKAGDIFVVGGWADGKSIPNADSRDKGFTLALSLKKSDGTWIDPAVYPFNDEWVGWQQNCYAAAAGYDYTQIALYILYTGNCNKAKFTNIFLHREAYGTTFGYDDNGNVLSTSNLAGQKSKATYDSADNVQTYVQPGRDDSVSDNQYWAYYGDSDAERKKHLPWRTRTPMHVMDVFDYDEVGNKTSSRRVDYRVYTEGESESSYPYIRTETTYSNDKNYENAIKNACGNTSSQNINPSDGTLMSSTDANGNTINYTYDASRRLVEVLSQANNKASHSKCTYEADNIKSVSHNTISDTNDDVIYEFTYDGLGQPTSMSIGGIPIWNKTYKDDRSGLLEMVQYSNNQCVKYEYDDYDRLENIYYNNETTPRYSYRRGANGKIAEIVDRELNRIITVDFDLTDRPCVYELKDHNDKIYESRYKYDKFNNLVMFSEIANSEKYTTSFMYDRDNRILEVVYEQLGYKISYTYDALGRLTSECVKNENDIMLSNVTYNYMPGGYGENSTTSMIFSINQGDVSIEYGYDENGNVTHELCGDTNIEYSYDELGQLHRVDSQNEMQTWVYDYDRGGNIISKTKYEYTTNNLGQSQETVMYSYNDENWKDKLTSFNGTAISYDNAGNPVNDGKWNYTWANGHKLVGMSSADANLLLTYNHTGNRIRKVYNTDSFQEVTDYTMHDQRIVHMVTVHTDDNGTVSQENMHFFFASTSRPMMVSYNGNEFIYVYNLHGDVIGIRDTSGNLVVKYSYDVWGNLLNTTGLLANTLGKRNPYRYRTYIYDEESQLYYLANRYYNPTWGRFLTPDISAETVPSVLLQERSVYSYCYNDPVSFADENGKMGFLAALGTMAVGGLVNAALGIVDSLVTGQAQDISLGSIAKDFVSGSISTGASLVYNPLMAAGCDIVLTAAEYIMYDCIYKGENFSATELRDKVLYTGVTSLIGNVLPDDKVVDMLYTIDASLTETLLISMPKAYEQKSKQRQESSSNTTQAKPKEQTVSDKRVVTAGTRMGDYIIRSTFTYPKIGELPILVPAYHIKSGKLAELAIYPR